MSQSVDVAERCAQAVSFLAAGRLDKAERQLKKVLKKEPRHQQALFLMGQVCEKRQRYQQASRFFQQLLQRDSDHAEAHLHLAFCLARLERAQDHSKVLAHFQRCEECGGSSAELYFHWGWYLQLNNDFSAAVEKLRQAEAQNLHSVDLFGALSVCYWRLYRYDQAVQYIKRALLIDPNSVDMVLNQLKFSEALNTVADTALEMAKRSSDVQIKTFLAACLLMVEKKWDQAIEYFARVNPADSGSFRSVLCHYLARAYEGKQDFANAIRYFSQANELTKQSLEARQFNGDRYFESLNNQAVLLRQADWLERVNQRLISPRESRVVTNNNRPSLCFLVGFPRSGTTLLGQVLNAHPQVYVADETQALAQTVNEFHAISGASLTDLPGLSDEHWLHLREFYWARQHEIPLWQEGATLVVDKMPLNMGMLPFIRVLFPEARFLYMQRHPLDSILSGFMQQFVLSDAMIQFLDISRATHLFNETYHFFQLAKDRLLDTQVHNVKYEQLVESFESVMREVLGFVGLDWREEMRDFYKQTAGTTRTNTPSSSAVNQALFTSARERWRHYAPFMAPQIFEAIGPVASEMGYSIEWLNEQAKAS